MKHWVISGAVLLALSVGVNAAALARLSRADHRPAAAPRAAAPDAERWTVEIRQIREDVARLKETPAAAPSFRSEAAPAPAAVEDPKVAELLREQETISRLWGKLDQLRAVRAYLPDDKFEQAALRLTVEALGLDGRFAPEARALLADLRQAARKHEEELNRIAAGAGSVPAGLGDLFEDQRRRIRAALATRLDDRRLHQLFRERLDEWLTTVLTE